MVAHTSDMLSENRIAGQRATLQTTLRLLRGALLTLPVLWVVVSVVFLLIHLVPGDPVVQMLGEGATPADVASLRHSFHLDLPLPVQYTQYWSGVLHGDLGTSLRLHRPVVSLIAERYPYTVALTAGALLLGLLLRCAGRCLFRRSARSHPGPGCWRSFAVGSFGA